MRTFIAIILLASLIAIFVYTQNNNSGHFSEDEDIEVASVSDLILGDDDADAEISKYVNIEETEVDRNSDNEIDNDIAGFLNDIDMGGPEMADGPTGTPYSAISPEYFGDAAHKEKYIHPEKHVAVSGVNNIVGVLKEAPFQP